MPVIDEEGNLFGYVNVVDAFVVLVLLGLVIGGLVLTLGAASGESRPAVVRIDPVSTDYIDEINETSEIIRVEPTYQRLDEGYGRDPYSRRIYIRHEVSDPRLGKRVEVNLGDGLILEGTVVDVLD